MLVVQGVLPPRCWAKVETVGTAVLVQTERTVPMEPQQALQGEQAVTVAMAEPVVQAAMAGHSQAAVAQVAMAAMLACPAMAAMVLLGMRPPLMVQQVEMGAILVQPVLVVQVVPA